MARRAEIPVDKCIVPSVRITAVYDDELQTLLSDSLAATGQIVPIVVVEHEGNYYVADGKHRLEDARLKGRKTVAAVIRAGQPEDVLLLNLVTNKTRGKVKASEIVTVLKELFNVHGLGIEQIQERTGFSRELTERYLRVAEAAPAVLDALDKELIGIGVAFQISRLPATAQQNYAVSRADTFHMTEKDMKRLVDDTLAQMAETPAQPSQPSPAPERRVPTCDICAAERDVRDLRMMAVCTVCHGVAWSTAESKKGGRKDEGSSA